MKDFKKVYDANDVVESAEGKLYKIQIDGEAIIWVEKYNDLFSVYWKIAKISKSKILKFINSSLKKAKVLKIEMIVYSTEGRENEIKEIEGGEIEQSILENIKESIAFIRVNAGDVAITADLTPTRHNKICIAGVIVNKTLNLVTKEFLSSLIAEYFQLTHRFGKIGKTMRKKDIKKFKTFLLKEIF